MQAGFATFRAAGTPVNPDDINIVVEMPIVIAFEPELTIPGFIGTIELAECPPCVLAASDGTLLVATGVGAVRRMRQNERVLSNAGVPAPKSAPVLKSSADQDGEAGAPEETRTQHFDYSQWGRTKAVWAGSPVSTLAREVLSGRPSLKAREGDLYRWLPLAALLPGEAEYQKKLRLRRLFMGYTAVQPGGLTTLRWDWNYLTFDIEVVDPSTLNGSPGVGVITGHYQAYMLYVDKDGNASNPSPISVDALLTAEPYVQYEELEVPDDERVVRRQLWRNDNGQSKEFYLDIDTTDLTSTSLRSYHTDAQLVLSSRQPFEDPEGFSLINLYGEPPADAPFMAEYVSRIWFGGRRDYSMGNAAVTYGSTTVTGVGTRWTASMAGRNFIKAGRLVLVVGVDPAAQTLILADPWAGGTDPYGEYVLRTFRGDANNIQGTSSGRPEAVQADVTFDIPIDNDEETGYVAHAGSLLILKQRHIYNLSAGADPKRDCNIHLAAERGCVGYRCAVAIGGVVFMLDRGGVHAFSGGPDPAHASMPVGDIFREEGESFIKINWKRDACHWHAVHQEEQGLVRWYVTMGGDVLPKHAICLDYRRARWWVESYPLPITASCLSNAILGRPILGGGDGELLTSDTGPLDLIPRPEGTRLAVSAADAWSVTAAADLPDDLDGVPVAIVEGPGRGQLRIVGGTSGRRLWLKSPWSKLPTGDSVLQIGAIPYAAITGEFSLAERTEANQQQAVKFAWQPSEAELKLFIKVKRDGTTYLRNSIFSTWGAVTYDKDNERYAKHIDLTEEKGYGKINFDRSKEFDVAKHSTVQIELEGFSGEERPRLSDLEFIGAT
jgi:hypothetical protein